MSQDATEHGLDAVEIFHDLTADERARLTAELDTLSLKRGETLVRQGETADALYIVVTGRFVVTLHGSRQPIAELGPGQPVGEIAFLAGGARTATVTALRDSLVLRLGRADFEALSAKSPSIWRTLTVALARRVAEANVSRPPPPDPRPRTLALIRAGDSALPPVFVERLVGALGRSGKVLLLDAARARDVLPAGTALDSAEATRALNALEGRTDYVLFLADAELTSWSEKAIRQADLVLAIGWHAAGERPNRLERLAAELLPGDAQRLVLLHGGRGTITGTARWLTDRRIAMHHHVALDEPDDMARLARFVARNGARTGRVRRRRLLRGPHRTVQGPATDRRRLRHDGRHVGRRRHGGGLRDGHRARRHRPRHARHLRHQQGDAALHLAALQPARPQALRRPARPPLRRRSTSRICGSPTSPSPPT